MAYGNGYRYRRRPYRRGYKRYRRYGTSLRRYRAVQMNDNETKIMTFSCVHGAAFNIAAESSSGQFDFSPVDLLNGPLNSTGTFASDAGRIYFAGMLFDRMRFRSLSVSIRPNTMPSGAGVANYNLYAAWDRYGQVTAGLASYSIQTDPSSKQVTWTPGGSGTPLRTYIYSTFRDKYQYFPISHNSNGSWTLSSPTGTMNFYGGSSPFFPHLLLSMVTGTRDTDLTVSITLHIRATIEFQGGYSSASLNVTSAASGASVLSVFNDAQKEEEVDTLTARIQKFQLENPE